MAFHEDPSVLTKDKLKNELTANNVPLPSGEHKKEVYVQLYLKNLTVLNNKTSPPPDTFSSDDEFTPPVVSNRSRSGRKADRKTDRPRTEETDVTDLTDEDLREQLVKHGVDTGPIVASTRKVYEKKLQKLLDEPAAESPGVPEATPEITALSKADSNQNGNTHSDQYSDKEDEEIAAPEPEPVPVVEKSLRSRGKTPLTVRTSSRKQTKVVVEENLSSGDHTSSKGSESVVEDILANEISTPTSFGISCRRPIRGAAGRPLKPSEYWLDESLVRRTVHTENRSYSESISSVGSPRSSSKAPAHRSILSMLLRLLLLAALAASLYYAYKNLDHQQVSGNLKGLLDSVVTPLQGVVDSATTYLGINGNKAVEGSSK